MKFKPSVAFTRNEGSESTGIMADCLYFGEGDASADASCPKLHDLLFTFDSPYCAGWGAAKHTIHIGNEGCLAICGWRPRSMYAPDQGICTALHYDTKYKVCIKCRRILEGGE